MSTVDLLTRADVPAELHADAMRVIDDARVRAKGLLWHKIKTRYLRASEIADLLAWDAERLVDVRPDLADWDIAPMVNITAHGDNAPWIPTPDGGRPAPGRWLNADPASDEYRNAVAANYWLPGTHPRSPESRKVWYRRNAGEYRAWRLGCPIDLADGVHTWQAHGVTVMRCGCAWLVKHSRSFGPLVLHSRQGYEIDNLQLAGGQAWYPISGHDLRAPVTWSTVPRWRKT